MYSACGEHFQHAKHVANQIWFSYVNPRHWNQAAAKITPRDRRVKKRQVPGHPHQFHHHADLTAMETVVYGNGPRPMPAWTLLPQGQTT